MKHTTQMVFLISLALFLPGLAASQCLNTNAYMHGTAFLALDGEPTTLLAYDDKILAHYDDQLVLIDVSDPQDPVILGAATVPTGTMGIVSDGDYAYLAVEKIDAGLHVVDIRDPQTMSVIGSLGGFTAPQAVIMSGATVFVADRLWLSPDPNITRLVSVDVGDPANPVQLDSLDLPDGLFYGTWLRVQRDLLFPGSTFLFTGAMNAVHIINADVPANLVHWSSAPLDFESKDVAISGNTAIVVGEELAAVDLTNPAHPIVTSSIPVQGPEMTSIHLQGNMATIRAWDHLRVCDITDPGTYVSRGQLTLPSTQNLQLGYFGDHVVSLRPEGVFIASTVPAVPMSTTWFNAGGSDGEAREVLVDGSLAYTSTHIYGTLKILDMADPQSPVVLGSVPIGDEGFSIDKEGDLVAAAFINWIGPPSAGVQFIDVSDPTDPTIVSTYDIVRVVYEVSLSAGRAYVPTVDGVFIVDVSDPALPVELGLLPVEGVPHAVGNTLYLATEDAGLKIYDVTDPASVVEIGSEPGGSSAEQITVEGDLVILGDAYGFRILDVSNPAAPQLLGDSPTKRAPGELSTRDGYLYAATGAAGVEIFDIIDPALPRPIMDLGIGKVGASAAGSLGLGPDYLLAATGVIHTAGLPCRPVAAVPTPRALQMTSAPNPFNPQTTIHFELPGASRVTLDVHDLRGRKIRTLVDQQEFAAGAQQKVWDGRDDAGRRVSSGVYFARVRTESSDIVRKMMLVK